MRRATLYTSPDQMAAAACPECGTPNGAHTPEQATVCWRTALRHPDADADDMLATMAGPLIGILHAATPGEAAARTIALVEELNDALEDRLGQPGWVEAEIVDEEEGA